jgi:hypothetical protein
MNRMNGPKRMRSATAPTMRAGVMMANLPWNITKASSGMPTCFAVAAGSPEKIRRYICPSPLKERRRMSDLSNPSRPHSPQLSSGGLAGKARA